MKIKLLTIKLFLLLCILSCNSQNKKTNYDTTLLNIIKERNFIIESIDFIVALSEIEYLLKNDTIIEKAWQKRIQYYEEFEINYYEKIFSSFLKNYVEENGSLYMSDKLNFIEKLNTTIREDVKYIYYECKKDEIVGVDESDFLEFAFYYKDDFFEMVEKDNRLQEIYKSMLEDDRYVLYLVLFDTSLCEINSFKKRKLYFLKDHFKNCKSKYGKMLYEELKKVDIERM